MNIIIDENSNVSSEIQSFLMAAAEKAVSDEGLDPSLVEISLTVVSEEEIHELNRMYRDTDRVTDVLSFPQYDDLSDVDNDEVIALGDVVICDAVAHRQAEEYGHSYEREFVYLFVHSVLHLLGYDHMEADEKREMRAREEEIMNSIGLTRGFTPAEDADLFQKLMRRAEEASANSYAPYSGLHVGAALLAEDGSIYTGVNIENASYGATLCAERSAVACAVSDGCRKFKAIAVYSPDGKASPCGICRQVLLEFGGDIKVIQKGDNGGLHVTSVAELLPEGFVL